MTLIHRIKCERLHVLIGTVKRGESTLRQRRAGDIEPGDIEHWARDGATTGGLNKCGFTGGAPRPAHGCPVHG